MVDTDSEDWDIQISRRQFILEKLILCEKLKLENMFFVKTKEIKEDDLNKINKNMGEINGYNKRLIEEEDTKKNLIDKVQAGLKEINDVKMDIEKMDRSIKEHDNDELITVDVWNAKETWEWFEWLERDFDLKYEILIDKFDKITNGKSNFKIEQENIHQIKGKLIGKFMRGLYASIEVKTKKSTKYASKIISDKKEKEILTMKLKIYQDKYDNLVKNQQDNIKLIQDLERFNLKLNEENKILFQDKMTLEEARQRLNEYMEKSGLNYVNKSNNIEFEEETKDDYFEINNDE